MVLLNLFIVKQSDKKYVFFLGLPVQVRDEALQITDSIPKGQVNKEYFAQNAEAQVMNII